MQSPQPLSDAKVTHTQINDGHAKGVGYPPLLKNVPNEVLSYIFVLCSYDSVRLPYKQANIPCQIVLSRVCSKWRQVALSTGALWSNIGIFGYNIHIIKDYERHLCLYRAWIDRAGAHPLTMTIELRFGGGELQVFQDFVLPFNIRMLDIAAMYEDLPRLSNLPTSNVEEFAITLFAVMKIEKFVAPPFMNKIRSICLRDGEGSQVTLKELSLPWHQLRLLECDSQAVPLSPLLSVLPQAQSLEQCILTIYKAESVPLVGIFMPSLHRLTLNLVNVEPDIIIPLLATQNLTALCIRSSRGCSSATYDIIKRHHKLHQLQEFELYFVKLSTRIAQILADAPIVHKLLVEANLLSMRRLWKA